MNKKKVSISWSGGKDAAFALMNVLRSGQYEVRGLHTTFDSELKRVGLHGIHESLIQAQAETMGLPLDKLYLKASDSHDNYADMMRDYLYGLKRGGVEAIVYGDVFLEDLKAYREKMLDEIGMEAVFPLWGGDTSAIVKEIVDSGIETVICAADSDLVAKSAVGKYLDYDFLVALSKNVDPCGENGEFHSFVTYAPYFGSPIKVKAGATVSKEYSFKVKNESGQIVGKTKRFWFADLSLDETNP